MSNPQNSFVWYELMTSDMGAAERFYRAVVGWDAQDSGQTGMRYTLFTNGSDMGVAGLMDLPPDARAAGMQPRWVGYVGVPDADQAATRLAQGGGAVHKHPADIPNVGRFAIVADPQGAMFALFQPASDPCGAAPPSPAGWHELRTSDWESALAFYSGQFGWTKAESFDMGAMGVYQLFAANGAPVGAMMNGPGGQMPTPAWLFYFKVGGIEQAAERIRSNGGQVMQEPHEVPGGEWIVHATDPQGALFALVGPRN
jgi:hypothetical protein